MNRELLIKAIELAKDPKNFNVIKEENENNSVFVNLFAADDTTPDIETRFTIRGIAGALYKTKLQCQAAPCDPFGTLNKNCNPKEFSFIVDIIRESTQIQLDIIEIEQVIDTLCPEHINFLELENSLRFDEKDILSCKKAEEWAKDNKALKNAIVTYVELKNSFYNLDLSSILNISFDAWVYIISVSSCIMAEAKYNTLGNEPF